MRWLGSLVVSFVLLLPPAAHAQAVTLKDLTGTWVGSFHNSNRNPDVQYKDFELLVIRPDSTGLLTSRDNRKLLGEGKMDPEFRRIRLIGDTALSLYPRDSLGYKITLQDQQLTLKHLDPKVHMGGYYTFQPEKATKPAKSP